MITRVFSLALFLSLLCFVNGCWFSGPHPNEEERFYIRNTTNAEFVWQTFWQGKQGANMVFETGVTDYAGSGGQLGVDSVKFIKGSDTLIFFNPKYDLTAYQATEAWNFFKPKNWIEERENVFVYMLREEYF
jgi:hypothetical protein